MTNSLWYAGRGFGVSALCLFSLVMILGILTRAGRPVPGLTRFAVAAIHRTTSLTGLLFVSLHVLTLTFDRYAQLRLIDWVVPFVGNYRPVWQGLGTVAIDLVLVVIASSLLRRHIGLRTWRVLHAAAYLCWPVAVLHAFGNGTDRHSQWLLIVLAVCVGSVGLSIVWRVFGSSFAPEGPAPSVAPPSDLAGLS